MRCRVHVADDHPVYREGIARELHLSPATVESQVLSLHEKPAVNDRAAAEATALRSGPLE